MNKILGTIVAVIVAAVVFRASAFIVDQRQYAIVFALGQIKEVITEPGLHFKLPPPFQNVVYVDKRILTIDTPQSDRVQTSEKKNLLVDSFVKWRISDPRRYWVSFTGSERAAQERISSLVRDAMNQAVNKRTVNDITSRERDRAMEEIRVAVQERVKEVGVEIVDVRLKRVDFVPEINSDVFRRMASERQRVATEQRSIGAAEGEKIRADADRQREVLLAEAYRDAQKIKGEGDARASAIYAQAFGQNPEFFNFYRSLEAYRASFRNRSDLLVIDPSSEFFKYMKNPAPGRSQR
ncbi:protease modulator HflC [Betaproteobacteria bacterium PRO7]|jgi:membrane protease subunit HflC|nr:protease modulator HflC [Burkholderiaceae bacterium]MDL1861047.1 protease modulator HflC [Betaproteobacteria bacterium PRO7]GIL04691.1 MAG: protein HflC [Betaproteobacteria bacterium]